MTEDTMNHGQLRQNGPRFEAGRSVFILRSSPGIESLRLFLLSLWRDLEEWCGLVDHGALGDLDLFDVFARRKVEHHLSEELFQDGAESAGAGAALERFAGDCAER